MGVYWLIDRLSKEMTTEKSQFPNDCLPSAVGGSANMNCQCGQGHGLQKDPSSITFVIDKPFVLRLSAKTIVILQLLSLFCNMIACFGYRNSSFSQQFLRLVFVFTLAPLSVFPVDWGKWIPFMYTHSGRFFAWLIVTLFPIAGILDQRASALWYRDDFFLAMDITSLVTYFIAVCLSLAFLGKPGYSTETPLWHPQAGDKIRELNESKTKKYSSTHNRIEPTFNSQIQPGLHFTKKPGIVDAMVERSNSATSPFQSTSNEYPSFDTQESQKTSGIHDCNK